MKLRSPIRVEPRYAKAMMVSVSWKFKEISLKSEKHRNSIKRDTKNATKKLP
jgi:hypothetical protein